MRLISAAFIPVDKLSRLQTPKNAKKFNRLADIKDKNPYISSGTKKGLDFFFNFVWSDGRVVEGGGLENR